MIEFNQPNFNPDNLKKSLEAKFDAKLVITSTGESKKDFKEKNDFIEFVANLDNVLLGQECMLQDFGIDLSIFLQPLHDANIYLLDQLYSESGRELILMFIDYKDSLTPDTPMLITIGDKKYSVVDVEELFYTIKLIKSFITPTNKKRIK